MQLICINKFYMSISRKTKSIELVLNSFDNTSAVSVIELVEKFKNHMNKTTVYRILERLEKSNILHSFIDNEGLKRYAKNEIYQSFSNPPHFLCEDCGESSCLEIEMNVPSLPRYKIKNSEQLLIGQCEKCFS